ncbi:MAG TPA: hypothetical protein PLP17_00165 [Oligoflexia bacterium]|nr:hypothetical protein [Oligoflexia bacterium]
MVRTIYKLQDVPENRRGFTLVWDGNPVLMDGSACGSLNLFEVPGEEPAETADRWSALVGFELLPLVDLNGKEIVYRCGTQEVRL